jgi:hypothetical protein
VADQSAVRIAASSVDVASMAWALTQHQPMGTDEIIREAERRGVTLDLSTLRELYRHRLLVPFLYVNNRQVGPPPSPVGQEPRHPGGTLLQRLRHARDRGRLSDPAAAPFRPRLHFDLPAGRDRQRWWNGFIYSHYQLLALPEIDDLLSLRRYRLRDHQRIARLPDPDHVLVDQAARVRDTALALTALDARYFPALDPEWVRLSNADPEEWRHYRATFDPVAMNTRLGYSASQAREDAEWLLIRAHRLDPVGDSWSQLMRRAPSSSWERLNGASLMALDYRIAAEILLLFYEDLADHGQAESLPDIPPMAWHPLHERLSYRRRTLDEDLMDLGVSPHPRVVLAVEGQTEQVHVPLIWKELEYPDAPELMRVLMFEGVARDLTKVAALAAAPLVGEKAPSQHPAWLLIKPPTRLFIAADPEGPYAAGQVDQTKTEILNEIRAVLRAQGVERPNPPELAEVVEIRTWSASCYEFAHFTDDELADGIMEVHRTLNGLTTVQLVDALAYWRARGDDIKRVWRSGWDPQMGRPAGRPWEYQVGKPELARALWPALKGKIDLCRVDPNAPIPEIVEVLQDSYHLAQRWRYLSFVLTEEPEAPEMSE